MIEDKKPEIIYHYCSIDTFMKIIENKSLWLSDTKKMNDFHETSWIKQFIDSQLAALDKSKNKGLEELLKLHFDTNLNTPYIACFSEEGDLLSQWRGYADDGNGISIGFSRTDFGISEKLPSVDISSINTIGLQKCIYDKEQQNNLVKFIFENINKTLDLYDASERLKKLSYLFKNHGFSEEKEWRIIHTPVIKKNENGYIDPVGHISDIKFRSLKNDITSYFIYNFKEKGNSLLKEVILGPKCKANEIDLKIFLNVHGFTNTEIKYSKISYR